MMDLPVDDALSVYKVIQATLDFGFPIRSIAAHLFEHSSSFFLHWEVLGGPRELRELFELQ